MGFLPSAHTLCHSRGGPPTTTLEQQSPVRLAGPSPTTSLHSTLHDLAVLHSSLPPAAAPSAPTERQESSRMPATPTIIGALLGLGTQMYSNALRKLPYMRRIAPLFSFPPLFPHRVFISPFRDLSPHCAPRPVRLFVNQLVKFDEKVKEDLDKMLERARVANEQRYIG
nr:unnamed protein product [Digitaria exilis]